MDDTKAATVDSQWGEFFRNIGGAAVSSWLSQQNPNQPPPANPALNTTTGGVPRWVIYVGVGVSILGLILLLRRS